VRLMGTAHARTKTFLAASAVVMIILIGAAALVAGQITGGQTRTDAQLRGAHGAELLLTVGADFPRLSPSTIAHTLAPAVERQLDGAVKRVQQEGLLANLVIWDRSGRVVYSSLDSSEGSMPPKDPELVAALAGNTATATHDHEVDPSSGKPTGLLDVFQPLSDQRGVVYGAIEASLPLRQIDLAAAQSERRSILFVIGAGALLWLLLLPLWIRLARSQANDWIPARRKTLRAFSRALNHGQIELVYQPQIEPASQRIDGVEALVRWRRNGVLVGPDQFLPAVESSALMARLTDRVLDLALAQHARWRAAGIVMRIAVNLSSSDLADKTLPQRIAVKLDRHGVMGQSLTIEVTETALLSEPEHARVVLTTLDQMGIDIAVDDFGTGHASIARLHQLPVSEVKIDRSFVSDTQQHSRTYLAAMVAFGHSLGLRVVAEGVEDAETLSILTTLGCEFAQGYFISRPLEPAAMTAWLTAGSPATHADFSEERRAAAPT
jgi:EAL domain-containing protein (putative c-di-GMP-specific phosphodiesterase class I)